MLFLHTTRGMIPSAVLLGFSVFPMAVRVGAVDTKTIPITIRDFSAGHPDFESPVCYGGKNMVQPILGPEHKPVHTAANFCPDNGLDGWFRDTPDNTRYCREMVLSRKAGTENIFELNDNAYFPIDDVPTKEPGFTGDDGMQHDFHFCMEMHATFKYRGGEVFNFKGDDDVWVYINNKLSLDLGGVHTPQSGAVDLDAMRADLGIATGNYYNFDFFFCERQTTGSNLMLNTSIDIIPPPAPGYYIADANLNVLHDGDTVSAPQGLGTVILKAVEIRTQSESIDCSDVTTQVKSPVSASWEFAGSSLPPGPEAVLDPDRYAGGAYLIRMDKDGFKDSAWVLIRPLPRAGTPAADPPGREFTGSLDVTLTTPTAGAAIRYTLDGSEPTAASPLYATPIRLSADATLKAIAVGKGYRNSAVMTETYRRRQTVATAGYYQDRDGDGRIETAVLLFDDAFVNPPPALWLTDPFLPSRVEKLPTLVAGPRSVTATFPRFSPGTGFTPAGFARIPAEPGLFDAQSVILADSVGPVLDFATAFPAAAFTGQSSVEIGFSEPVVVNPGARTFPYDLKRRDALVDAARIRVASVTSLSTSRYRYAFLPGSAYPVPGDSLRIKPASGLTDVPGNRADMRFFIPVAGDPVRAETDIGISLVRAVTESVPIRAVPDAHAVLVHSGGVCLNCGDPEIRKLLPEGPQGEMDALGPTWKVTTKFPFAFELAVFDNLGQFVNRADGTVAAEQLARIPAGSGPDDSVRVALTFLPVSRDGNLFGTGAYIMRGTVSILAKTAQKGAQGEDLILLPAAKTIVSRFGYLRR